MARVLTTSDNRVKILRPAIGKDTVHLFQRATVSVQRVGIITEKLRHAQFFAP